MENKQTDNRKKDFIFVGIIILLICIISLFNYIVDPYCVFGKTDIKGFNNIKTYKYSNKREVIYSDIKINSKNKDTVFTGNCLLSHYGAGLENVAFFTIPVTKIDEITKLIKNVKILAPEVKKIYWGLYFDDFWNDTNEELNVTLPELNETFFSFQDFINLFFSYNTTKYSIGTVIDSIKNKGDYIIYIYPYREIAKKIYKGEIPFKNCMEQIKEAKQYADKNNIEIIIYYSPIHITKKIHIYEKGKWDQYQELKRRLVQIMPFYDYSFSNDYNTKALDENSIYFIDNVHTADVYNNMIVNDLLSEKKEIGILVNNNNINEYLKQDTENLKKYIKKNKVAVEKIKNVKPDDAKIKIRKNIT